ncbi:TOG array regulator of axonemal microtubules protein 1-like isoform X1 [Rhopilema esculentum]|uniref:TOG array regulator of axonemal microtubules protein 1-like isoform X1 n=1 Tax=Rhopilema esculentum TaxID=499914 RepID=UPI0031D7378D
MIIQKTISGENIGPMEKRTESLPNEEQRLESLQKLQKCCTFYGAEYINDNFRSVLMLLAHGLQDNSPVARKLSIEITSEVLPCLETGGESDKIITKEIIPRLVANLCFSNTAIKKCTVHTLHVYMKHFNRVQDVLRVIISQLDSGDAKTRTELMVALPIIITPAFAEEDIFELISALVHRLEVSSIKSEHNAPSMICLEKIKSVLGENVFLSYINRLPDRLQKEYNLGVQKSILAGQDASAVEKQTSIHSLIARTLSNGSIKSNGTSVNGTEQSNLKRNSPLAKSTSSLDKTGPKPVNSAERVGLVRARSTERLSKTKGYSDRSKRASSVESVPNENGVHSTSQTLYYGFIPAEIILELEDSSWKTRANGIEALKLLVESIQDNSVLLNSLGDLLEMLTRFVEDSNFKILLTSLHILRDVIEKVGDNLRPHMELLLAVVQTKLGDSKVVIKQLNMQILLNLMHVAKPWAVLKPLMPCLNHRNSKIREDIINMITAALLTFPSSDFNLTTLPGLIAPMLIDAKRKVRQAVLECFAVIAQSLGPGRMQPLVTSVDMIELNPEGEGVMEAVQARLARRKLPKITPEGTIEYSMIVTTAVKHNSLQVPPDVSWILYGPSGLSGESGKTSGEGIVKRYRSAGKKRLPWESDDETTTSSRKSIGSAPIQSQEDRGSDPIPYATRNSWAPGQNVSYTERYQIKGKLGTMPLKQQENLEFVKSDSVGSYFHMYKQRMRKLKQAGLQADNTMINTLNRGNPLSPSDPQNPLVPKSAIGRDTIRTPVSGSRSPVAPHEDKPLSASWSGSEYNESRNWLVAKKPADLEPIGTPVPETDVVRDIESPVHLKPAIARSASKKRRQLRLELDKTNNLKLEDEEENDKKKKSPVDPLANIKQQAHILKQQKVTNESQELGSPFDSRPKIARSPSARKSRQKPLKGDATKPSSDTSESGKETPSPREKPHRKELLEKSLQSPHDHKKEGWNEANNFIVGKSMARDSILEDSLDYEDDFEIPESNGAREETSDEGSSDEHSGSSDKMAEARAEDSNKGHSSLSKSALERVKQRRSEEMRKRELSLIKQREKEAEERLKAEREAKEAEERKQAERNRRIAEMKRIEDLLKAEERKKEEEERRKEEELQKKKRQEEEERRIQEELNAKREMQAKLDAEEMKRAEELSRKAELNRREQRMKELEALIKAEEVKHEEMRRKSEEAKKQEEDLEMRRQEEIRRQKEKEVEAQIEEERMKRAEAELKEARRKKAELKRIKEIEAKKKEEEERRTKRMTNAAENNGNEGHTTKYEAFAVNLGDCERSSGVTENRMNDDANNNSIKPAASRSPRLKKNYNERREGRALSGSHVPNHVEIDVSAVRRSCTEGHMAVEPMNPFDNPELALKDGLRQIAASSEDWEMKCEGLQTFRRLAMFHPDVICQHLHTVCLGIVAEVKNLRSQVSRTAIQCLGETVSYLPKQIEPELDMVVSTLLSKSSESNAFIKEDVEKSLSAVASHVNCVKAMGAFINGGAGHRNAQVRKMCARFLSQLAERIGVTRLLSGGKDVTERILPVAAQFAVDGNQETRYYGRCILYLMIDHPDLERLIEKHLPKANVRPAKDIVENLKAKGLRDAPNEHGSASIRRSQRHAGSGVASNSVARSSTFNGSHSAVDGRQGSGNKALVRASTNKAARQQQNSEGYQPARPLDLESIAGLNANEWKTRLDAIENFYHLVRTNPDGVASHISKVFDKFIPRLTDSNSKVNLQALQTMNKAIPILRDALTPLITLLMQSLTSCVASKNNAIYNAGMEVLISLTKFVDNVILLQPLITAVRYGNTRVKPEMAMRLADLVTPVFQRKPSLVQTHILPVLWHLLSTSKVGSAANARNDISTATAKLCEELYICYGESLYDEAESQGKNVKEKLKHYMM